VMADKIQVYQRQAKNIDAETQACRIRLRAERRMGELLASMEKARGGGKIEPGKKGFQQRSEASTPVRTLKQLGLTKDESSRAQQLASIPREQFEEGLATERPTAAGIIAQAKPRPERGPNAKGWGDFLRDLGIEERTARRYMELVGYVESISDTSQSVSENIPTYAEAGIKKSPSPVVFTDAPLVCPIDRYRTVDRRVAVVQFQVDARKRVDRTEVDADLSGKTLARLISNRSTLSRKSPTARAPKDGPILAVRSADERAGAPNLAARPRRALLCLAHHRRGRGKQVSGGFGRGSEAYRPSRRTN